MIGELNNISEQTLNIFKCSRLKTKRLCKNGITKKITTLNPAPEIKSESATIAARYGAWATPVRSFLRKYSYELAKRFDESFESAMSYMLLSRAGTDMTPVAWRSSFIKEFTSLIELQKEIVLETDRQFNFRKLSFFCFKNRETCNVPARFNPRLVFILMPFSSDFNDVYDLGIKPIVESLNLICVRADEIQHSQDILCGSICQPIQECRFLIADLSGRNPNVFYELGLAHGFEKEIVLVTNNIKDVPFDIRGMNIVIYRNISSLRSNLENRLKVLTGIGGQN